ncbi:MerR family transcriptional regulator [Streptomyces sp. NRRL S-87]|uniref:helix-turn-helix domain-containing protein n=1 Tax=Streptomyces sp. NRRL S-87 TaxID=1463920 RepID=UPI0004C128C7|nr:MerR family transcriptional regulator [Streptomyces sp. NRRL S-87]
MTIPQDGPWSIGELAERAGTTVKTVRFYSDGGLLPEASRSSGGHRRYGPDALDRLELIRSLRALDLPVPEVRRILEDDGTGGAVLADAVAGQLRELGDRIQALRWREAGLQLVQECAPEERADRLRLIGAVAAPPNTDTLVRFWRAWLPPRMAAPDRAAFLEVAVPAPPVDPEPGQVLAFARLNAFVTQPCIADHPCQPAAHHSPEFRPDVLYAGLAEAYDLAAPHLRRGREPRSGEALDCFVGAYADAFRTRDTAGFRHVLGDQLAGDPRIDRYWELVAEVRGSRDGRPVPTPGAAHDWLLAALTADPALRAA